MKVLKFGGSSVANPQNIQRVTNIVDAALQENERVFVVLSAMGGVTDSLLQCATWALGKNEEYE